MIEDKSFDLRLISTSDKTQVTVSREELAALIDEMDVLTLHCQRLLHKLQRISMRLVDDSKQ